MLKLTLLQKFMKLAVLKLTLSMINHLKLENLFNIITQNEKLFKPYSANNSEKSDFDVLKIDLHGNHAA